METRRASWKGIRAGSTPARIGHVRPDGSARFSVAIRTAVVDRRGGPRRVRHRQRHCLGLGGRGRVRRVPAQGVGARRAAPALRPARDDAVDARRGHLPARPAPVAAARRRRSTSGRSSTRPRWSGRWWRRSGNAPLSAAAARWPGRPRRGSKRARSCPGRTRCGSASRRRAGGRPRPVPVSQDHQQIDVRARAAARLR